MDTKTNYLLKTKKYILIGAGGHAKVIKDILDSQNKEIVGYFDDNRISFDNIKYLGKIEDIYKNSSDFQQYLFIIAIGNNTIRKEITTKVKKANLKFGRAIHPTAVISKSVVIKEGSVVMPNVTINSEANIGEHCIINTGSIIEHECIIKDFVHVSPGSSIAGTCYIDEGTHIGIGTSCIQGLKIGKWCIIGAGSVVIRPVENYKTVYGVPAHTKERRNKNE